MTIPTGTLSMDDIRTEYGLSGELALGSLYAGGSIIAAGSGGYSGAIPSSGSISLNNFRGHSAPASILDTQTVTLATMSYFGQTLVGKEIAFNLGSVSDGTSNILGGAAIRVLMWGSNNSGRFTFAVTGTKANSGFTTINVNGVQFNRTDATFIQGQGNTTWLWSSGTIANPYAGVSGTRTVTWA